jgi:hypothetical protein
MRQAADTSHNQEDFSATEAAAAAAAQIQHRVSGKDAHLWGWSDRSDEDQ